MQVYDFGIVKFSESGSFAECIASFLDNNDALVQFTVSSILHNYFFYVVTLNCSRILHSHKANLPPPKKCESNEITRKKPYKKIDSPPTLVLVKKKNVTFCSRSRPLIKDQMRPAPRLHYDRDVRL